MGVKMVIFIDTGVLQEMFEGKNEGKAKEVMEQIKNIKDGKGGVDMKVLTNQACFMRALFLMDPKCGINYVQKVLSFLEIGPSAGVDFKDKDAVHESVVKYMQVMNKKMEADENGLSN